MVATQCATAMAFTGEDRREAHRRFAAWLRYCQRVVPGLDSQAKLAERLGISGAAVTYLMAAGSDRIPDADTLIAVRELLKGAVTLDMLLFVEPFAQAETAPPGEPDSHRIASPPRRASPQSPAQRPAKKSGGGSPT